MGQSRRRHRIKVVKHEINRDAYFDRGDNITFAGAGVPATSLSAAYEDPDLRKPSDEWPKLDYENMAQVDRCALWDMANTDKVPQVRIHFRLLQRLCI